MTSHCTNVMKSGIFARIFRSDSERGCPHPQQATNWEQPLELQTAASHTNRCRWGRPPSAALSFCGESVSHPVAALLFSSVLGTALLMVRVVVSHRLQHLYLVGNLLLAWVPFMASLLLDRWDNLPSVPGWKRVSAFAIWFLFFPNAPYILTDLVHLGPKYYGHFWIDLLDAKASLLVGHGSRVERRLNAWAGWIFVAGMSLLCGIGIYAGRFLRWNSWDVIARPLRIASDLQEWLVNPFHRPLSIVFPLLFGLFLFTAYLTLLGLANAEKQSR